MPSLLGRFFRSRSASAPSAPPRPGGTVGQAEARAEADLRAAAAGDREAIARFYEAHIEALYAFVFHRVGKDPALTEDVVQETFTRAFRQISQFDPARGATTSWLTVVSRNAIRDALRDAKRADSLAGAWQRIDATLAQTFAAMAERPLPGEILERAETRDLVQMAIANLPEQYGIALTRKYVDGASLDALAGELGLSVDATKSLLARARRAFRDTFATLTTNLSEVSV
ncbi:MAG TPA: sigma-70 family RNA polymerase sigma factor [Kofleriaceae bacterium]|jgi:RNA polymerase sigma-70 factor (ECF subfamily)